MDTIAINAGQASGEEKKGKDKAKMSDSAKAAMATGAAGLAAGMAGKAIYDNIMDDPDPEPIAQNHTSHSEENMAEAGLEETPEAIYVNPDDVMLEDEEPVAELTDDETYPVEIDEDADGYRPLAENDPIDVPEEIIVEPYSGEEVLMADTDVVLDADPADDIDTIDLICGEPAVQEEQIDQIYTPEGDILADNGIDTTDYSDIDIQSDLMA